MICIFFFFKQKTAYEMRISDWSSDVCSSDLPFTQLVAEQFVNKNPGMKAPVIESTGTGGGMKLFCAGVGAQHPDIVNASRPLKASDYATCQATGARKSVVYGTSVHVHEDFGDRCTRKPKKHNLKYNDNTQ